MTESRNRTETLDQLPVGMAARIESVLTDTSDGAYLLEMGLTPGTTVSVTRVAPLGDPIDILVRGYHLSLRRSEARRVFVSCECPEEAKQ